DAIAEFRVITNTFDAEYGRNSGAVVNVVTQSGTNAVHGDVYEYFRNKVLNAQGFFNTVNPQFNQNQFGGTLGAPIKKDRTFFFGSYEGRRIRQGQPSELVQLPTPEEVSGDFSANGPFGGGISDQFVADAMNARTDAWTNPTTPTTCAQAIAGISGSTPAAAGVAWASVFPTRYIPPACVDPVAQNLLQYLPAANLPGSVYQGVPTEADNQDQFTVRVDHKINDRQNLSVYYYFTDERTNSPFYNFQASGANVPGFGTVVKQRFQQWNPSHTWSLSNALVNEFHATYLREGQLTFQHPQS